ncbi:hypothetical protein, partial [Streptomyces fuscigenes]|uniref:hypothetical protein n=1 Tax=Streptomyces fuscigenes TaxID=1528880 RepID=UPI001F20E853
AADSAVAPHVATAETSRTGAGGDDAVLQPPPRPRVRFADGTAPGDALATDARAPFTVPKHATVENTLDTYRRPRLDRTMLPPPRNGRVVTFDDGRQLPTYITGDGTGTGRSGSYGGNRVALRGVRHVVTEIGHRAGLSQEGPRGQAEALAELRRALRDTPWVFHGEGYRSPSFTDRDGQVRSLRVTTRPHNTWERFEDTYGSPFKFDSVQRSQVTTGSGAVQSTGLRVAPGFSLGPASGIAAYGRIAGGFGYTRTYEYAQHNQTLSQAETKMGDVSDLYLDDVQYEVQVEGGTDAAREPHFTFGVRNGLTVRLPASETRPGMAHGQAPHEMTIEPDAGYRLVHTEGFGPVQEIREWALRRARVPRGTTAHEEISGFFTTENFHRMADRLAHGLVSTRQLARDDKHRSPMGAFVVDRVVPGRATLLTETTAAELRMTVQQAVKNERTLSKTYSQEISAAVGPSFDMSSFFGHAAGLRAMVGAVGRYVRSTTHGTVFGSTANEKFAGQAKKVPTHLYLVQKTVYVRRTGDAEATPFTTWSLDRMTTTEARRLAGWDDGTATPTRLANEPFAPLYLPKDRPSVLGMSRAEAFVHEPATARGQAAPQERPVPDGHGGQEPAVAVREEPRQQEHTPEGQPRQQETAAPRQQERERAGERPEHAAGAAPRATFLQEFTQRVLAAAAAKYPDMIGTLEDFTELGASRWSSREHYRMALQNTLNVVNTLSHHSMAGNLATLISTGVRIDLVGPGRFHRAHRHLWIDGTLTDRRYEGTQNDLYVRTSAPATQRLDGQRNVVRGYEGGVEASLSVRDSGLDAAGAPRTLGTLQAGPRWGRQAGRRTGYGSTASFESLSAATSPSHLHSYRLELSASTGGYRRFRHLWRGTASLGVLGTQMFVRNEPHTDLVGGAAGDPMTGRVVLAVASEHTPERDPHATTGAGTPAPDTDTPLTTARAKALLDGDVLGAPPREENPFGDQPFHTVSVGAHPELVTSAVDVMRKVSNDAWFFRQPGAPAHEAMVRSLRSGPLTADFDQLSSSTGSRLGGLFGQNPYLNRLGALVHRMGVGNLRVVSRPVKVETEHTLGTDTSASGAVTTTHTFTLAMAGNAVHTQGSATTVSGTYGGLAQLGSTHGETRTVTRTVTSDLNVSDSSHKVLVVGDTEHEIAGTSRGDGLLAPAHALATWLRTAWAGRRLTFSGDWVGHVAEKAAHRVGLLRDGLGEVPRYTEHEWRLPTWWEDSPFGAYPVNSVDAAGVVAEFTRKLESVGADEATRDDARARALPRPLRALHARLVSGGTESRSRIGGPGWGQVRIGGRTRLVTAELIKQKTEFDGLGHSAVFRDGRHATETSETTRTDTRVKAIGAQIGEAVRTGDDIASAAGPTYSEQGSSTQQVTTSRTTTRLRNTVFSTNEPHAEYLTSYRLRLTLELGGGKRVTAEGDVGTVREQVPLSLAVPARDTAAPTPGEHDGAAREPGAGTQRAAAPAAPA